MTDSINKSNSTKNNKIILMKRNKKTFKHLIITESNAFLYKEKSIKTKMDNTLLQKIIPIIEEEFFLH